MPSEKMELEGIFFTNSDFSGNTLGFNPEPRRVYPEVAREMKRIPTSNVPINLSPESLIVTVKRVSEMLNNNQAYITMILDMYGKMGIKSNHSWCGALHKTRDSKELAEAFKKRFKEASRDFNLCHKQGSFCRCVSMYMDERWRYDY